ncbi:MAG: methyltransferase [Actinomycetes bacterium]
MAGRRSGPAHPMELLFLAGLGEVVEAEVRERLGGAERLRPVPGRSDSLRFELRGPWERLGELRTVVAAFAVLSFGVPRPRSLTSGEYLPEIVRTVQAVRELGPAPQPSSFRFDAAGATSSGFRRLAEALAASTGLRHDQDDGDLVLRFRRAVERADGWDVLVRLSTRPLSDRPWRVRHLPGAANATIAAAMARLTRPRPADRVANLMCGSGTLLVERLLTGPARLAVGVDRDRAVLEDCRANLAAAGLTDRAELVQADVADDAWLAGGPYDVLLADPPWGTLVGDHAGNQALHATLLERAHRAAAPGARLAVLTHEIRLMERCLDQARGLWTPEGVTRVYQKGHHPRIYLLRPAGTAPPRSRPAGRAAPGRPGRRTGRARPRPGSP